MATHPLTEPSAEPSAASASGTSPGRIVLVRHGETEWSRTGRHTGTTDIPLTALGEAQARSLRAPLSAWGFTQIRTSTLTRARQTAQLAGLDTPAPVVDADLAEWDYGTYEGLTSDEIHVGDPGWTIFADDAPGGESAEAVAIRVDRVLDRVRVDVDAGRDVALVAHGHLLRVLAARWLHQPARFGAHLAFDAGAISILDTEHDMPLLRIWNRSVDD
ncbi:MAG TPA: histidine phosphatase family protein [Acidimicrobiales bacterium]|nr:histidine phosphatase family protein [Acidimicrobiales bacterium]